MARNKYLDIVTVLLYIHVLDIIQTIASQNPTFSENGAKTYVQTARQSLPGINCNDVEFCLNNKDDCTFEEDRKYYCKKNNLECQPGQVCSLSNPCPGHHEVSCTDINECLSNPCKNGATCHDQQNKYTCECTEGWTGAHCEEALTANSGHISRRSILQDSSYSCDSGWILHGTSCYYLGTDAQNWDTAKSTCEGLQAYLAEVTDDSENAFLKQEARNTGSDMWIGLRDVYINSNWYWSSTGNKWTACTYDNWGPGEPNNLATEHCVHYFHSLDYAWNNKECSYSIGYICEKTANGALTSQSSSHHVSETNCTCQPGYTGDYCETDLCQPTGADIAFLMDVSLSQSPSSFQTQKTYIKDFVKNFLIGPSEFQFALVASSFNANIHFDLSDHTNSSSISSAVDNINFKNGPTFTGKGLTAIRDIVFTSARGARDDVKKYIIVLTDGLSSDMQDTKVQADSLKTEGVDIISVGVGKLVYHRELIDIASHWTRVFPPTSDDAVHTILRAQVMAECPDCYKKKSDVAILMDASQGGSVGRYDNQLSALNVLLQKMPVDEDGVHISFSQYADDVIDEFHFNDYMTSSDAIVRINKMRPMSSAANVTRALWHLRQNSFSELKGIRSESRKIVLLVTNGNFIDNNYQDIIDQSQLLKDSGVILATMTIGTPENITTLQEMTSDPVFNYIIDDDTNIKSDALHSLIGSLDFDFCNID